MAEPAGSGGVPKFIPNQMPEQTFDTASVSEENKAATAKTTAIAEEKMKSISEPDKNQTNKEITSVITKESPEAGIIQENPLIAAVQSNSPKQKPIESSVAHLMTLTEEQWKSRNPKKYLDPKMKQFCAKCAPRVPSEFRGCEPPGFLEKHDLKPGSEVAVIGDIHGNDLRLDLTLKALQKRGFLDDQFHCLPGKQLVFLGDYVDRGKDSLKVLELLATLKLENKGQVRLIRGNHEDLGTINNSKSTLKSFAQHDSKYLKYMQDGRNLGLLGQFYRSLPVTVYLGQKVADSDKKEYIQFCHGLFHLYTDPSKLLEDKNPDAHLWADGYQGFSHRINQMPTSTVEGETPLAVKQREGMEKLKELGRQIPGDFREVYWLDVGAKNAIKPGKGHRHEIPPELIQAYLHVISTDKAKPKEIIRGHQLGEVSIVQKEAKPGKEPKDLVTTLDPSGVNHQQTFMEIKLSDKVKDCVKTYVTLPMNPNHEEALNDLKGATRDHT
jgi:hypothetical protein